MPLAPDIGVIGDAPRAWRQVLPGEPFDPVVSLINKKLALEKLDQLALLRLLNVLDAELEPV